MKRRIKYLDNQHTASIQHEAFSVDLYKSKFFNRFDAFYTTNLYKASSFRVIKIKSFFPAPASAARPFSTWKTFSRRV